MQMDKIAGSGNDEFYTPDYAILPLLPYIPKGAKVWCPFDTERSRFVCLLRDYGCDVIATHINNGDDFFSTFRDCDYIVSNPPYSVKGEVLARLFELGKPFAMLVGVVGLFESQKRFELFKNHHFEIMYLGRRVSYLKSYDDEVPALNPPFSSVSVVRTVRLIRSRSSDHLSGWFFHCFVFRLLPRATSSALSYWTVILSPLLFVLVRSISAKTIRSGRTP